MKRRNFLFVAAALALMLVTALGIGAYKASAAPICTPASAISVPFTKDGAGDFCYQTSNLCTYINSWNVTTIEVNGTAYTNVWVSSPSIAPVGGLYTIHYVSAVGWGHFEIGAPCGTNPTTPPTSTATRTNTPNPLTPTRTPTCACLPLTPTRTPTNGPTATRTATGPALTPTRTATPTVGVPVTITRTPTATLINEPPLANPFSGAVWYRNPDYAALVNAQAASTGGSLGTQMAKVANYGTGIWLDSIDAVNGVNGYPRSLAGHLNAAVAQNANLVTIVLYDMPNRSCARVGPGSQGYNNGELQIANNGLNIYKTQYIDVIASIISNPAYANLRIVVIVEPDSLHNLVWNLNTSIACQEANTSGAYVQGIQYAINKLTFIRNTYLYLDIGHSGAPGGWLQNITAVANLYASTINGTVSGPGSINGFITNIANYSVTTEPYLTATQLIGGQQVNSASFFQWNPVIDEAGYATAWKNAMMTTHSFPAGNTNMIIDTSRNGWGGSSYGKVRPTGPSTSTLLNTFVDESRLDRRYDKFLWCNQAAGIGAIPQANPPGGVFQAYIWAYPPGISDGSSVDIPVGPQNPRGRVFNNICDPNFVGFGDMRRPTGAIANAPVAGAWFADGFAMLVANAFPPLP